MSEYATKLAERECKHIRETVKVTPLIGRAAYEDQQRELDERNAEMARLKAAVAINPITGRATDLDAFVAMCRKIVDLPYSPIALSYSLFDIMEIVKKPDYPMEDRQAIADVFNYVYQKGHIDNCACSQLYGACHTLHRVDHPDPPGTDHFSGNNPLIQDRRDHATHHAPKGPRHFKPTPLKK